MTQQNAALVEQAAAAAQSMQGQAASLAQAVSVFTLGNEAPAARPPLPRTAKIAKIAVSARPASKQKEHKALAPKAPSRALGKPARPNSDEWEEF
ncbi:MAG: hypothetical protein ABI476_01980, partial [Oxalobacteraceae bacterium]